MNSVGFEYLQGKSKRRLDVIGGVALTTVLFPLVTTAAAAASYDNRSLNPFSVSCAKIIGDITYLLLNLEPCLST